MSKQALTKSQVHKKTEMSSKPAGTQGKLRRQVFSNNTIGFDAHSNPSVTRNKSGGLPLNLMYGLENLSGIDLTGVRVHTNSLKPAQFNAHAYTQGENIYLGPGQQKHLPHEAWHAVQQLQERVNGTASLHGATTNTSEILESEADVMGAKALQSVSPSKAPLKVSKPIQNERQAIQCIARVSESEFFVAQVFDVLENVRELGATTEFVIWAQDGAITMVSHRRTNQGTTRRRALSLRDLQDVLNASSLRTFIGSSPGYFRITIEREANSWSWNSFHRGRPAGQPATPPEGRSVPIDVTSYSTVARAGVLRVGRELSPLLIVSIDGHAEMRISAAFDDDRLVSWSPDSYTNSGPHNDGRTASADTNSQNTVVGALLPFAQGLGQRTVDLVIRGSHSGRARNSVWQVQSTNVRRPAQPVRNEAQDIVDEYRATHAQIIADWRAGVQDAAIMAASFTLEQVALWVIGGWIFKVFGVGVRLVAPRLVGILRSAAGRTGAEYLETLIVRLARTEKDAFRRLMAKAETEGLQAFTVAEKAEITALFQRLEAMVVSPLTTVEKARVRSAMVGRFATARPTVQAAFESAGMSFQIHHRAPLEWGHLMRGFDVNAGANLIALEITVHRGVNAVWTRFRTAPASKITATHVRRVADIVDNHFSQWYNNPPGTAGLVSAVQAAKNAARAEVDVIVAALRAAP